VNLAIDNNSTLSPEDVMGGYVIQSLPGGAGSADGNQTGWRAIHRGFTSGTPLTVMQFLTAGAKSCALTKKDSKTLGPALSGCLPKFQRRFLKPLSRRESRRLGILRGKLREAHGLLSHIHPMRDQQLL
jgi:hypothetical protein